MVERNYDKDIAVPLVGYGNLRSPDEGFCEMALRSVKKHEVGIANGKDSAAAKEAKKIRLLSRLFLFVLLGGCGLYICLVGVDRQLKSHQASSDLYQCPSSKPVLLDIPEHFPQPKSYSRMECACTPVRNFVILSMQRSGSGWFETLLNNHPNISSHGEIFSISHRRENFTTISDTLDAIYNLEWNSSAKKNECTAAVGHKWMLNQGVMEYSGEIASYYKRQGVSIILLLRRNLLKRLISILANSYDRKHAALNGTHKSHVHGEEEAKILAKYKPIINIQHLPANLKRIQEVTADAAHFFRNSRLSLVYYEDLVKDPKSIQKVQEFLGVPSRNLESKQVKIHTKPLKDQIENWEEVLTTLKGTEFEIFLE